VKAKHSGKKVRKQIYLGQEQNDKIKQIAMRRRWTEAEVIREAIDEYMKKQEQNDPLLKLFDLTDSNPIDGSVHHDQYIYGNE
jgi:hypothetical protein